jgi:hypothetical protein
MACEGKRVIMAAMTLMVYKIHEDGRKTVTVPKYEVGGEHDPERLQFDAVRFPPCSCPEHRARKAARR